MKEKNPIDNVRFYMKDNPNEPIKVRKDQVSRPTKWACKNDCFHYIHNILSKDNVWGCFRFDGLTKSVHINCIIWPLIG